MFRAFSLCCGALIFGAPQSVAQFASSDADSSAETSVDALSELQSDAITQQHASFGHWGVHPSRYSSWNNHSNRLVPIYTFGITLDRLREQSSVYSDPERLRALYGEIPEGTLNPAADYFDQTDIYHLQAAAIEAGYKNIFLIIFDGMDWQTTRAAAIYQNQGRRAYDSGRGSGLHFQDDRRTVTDFGLYVTSPRLADAKVDVTSQTVAAANTTTTGGYDPARGGVAPWHERSDLAYLLGLDRERRHSVTDSAASATSMTAGIKTYNGSINVTVDGEHVVPIARRLQSDRGFKIGVVSSVPVSHATPGAAYANNVSRKDYQDISRDLLGLPSSAHRRDPLDGVDVLIGGGWGEQQPVDPRQGSNYVPGNSYLHQDDIDRVDDSKGGRYVVAQRTAGTSGGELLMSAADRAATEGKRLLGYFGTKGGHLPFRTADGGYNPTIDKFGHEQYTEADISENPTLAEMTAAALRVLETSDNGLWMMLEAGDVDWANHANNVDNSIGAVISGDEAFAVIMDWVDRQDAWDETAVIVGADHGHFLVIDDADVIIDASRTQP